ncbi:class I SAM-dependent methyltransferase [Maricaulis parjimensis]|uniref:class I SAM-dependent methyltransferase n=1 Tax=Maricaulis parjimensis TaxID=144023 RepID=UPI0019396408|nr:class I SAM-dependent methyltransferase [Maricaulis parjimensis]
MKRVLVAVSALFLAAPMAMAMRLQDDMPAMIEDALADESRPERDRQQDEGRHPADVLLFAGLEHGWHVADLTAGTGYYSRVLSTAVGAEGHVYAHNPSWVAERFPEPNEALAALTAERANMTHVVTPTEEFATDIEEPLDAVFMVLFYHDTLYDGTDRAAMNQAVYDALRPGGVYIVIDHHAPEGTGAEMGDTLHRMEASLVEEEVLAAGFVLDAESDMLSNPEDPRDISVFDPAIRRHTDRFVYRFRKPDM